MTKQLEVSDVEHTFLARLPRGWCLATLGQVSSLLVGFAFKSKDFKDSGIRLLRGDNIEPGRLRWNDAKYWSHEQLVDFHHLLVDEGDVILAMDRPVISSGLKIASVGRGDIPALLVQRVARIRSRVGPNTYLRYALEQPSFLRHLKDQQTGTMLPHISGSTIKSFELGLAPLPQQHRIVAEIEKQFTRLDVAIATLKRVQANLERARASVLKAAVEGRLVPNEAELARAEGRSYEPATVLLERILEARKRKHDEAQAGAKRRAKYQPPVTPDTAGLPAAPRGWTWTTLDALADVVGGVTKNTNMTEGREVPYLRVANVQRGHLDLTDVKTILAPEDRIEKLRLKHGDILLNEGGDRDKLGRGWIWDGQIEECIHQNHVFRARLFYSPMPPKYVSYYANSVGQSYFIGTGKQTTNLASISLTNMRKLPIALPPLAEQRRILNEVEEQLSVLGVLQLVVERNLLRCERLRQSILKHAFEGKLVPQDPNDEPASELLARIQTAYP